MRCHVVATDTGVMAPFFAALDATDDVTWTDDRFHALEFDTSAEAEDFARTRIGDAGWKVQPIC